MADKYSPDYWRRVKPDSIVTLTDEQALQDSLEESGQLVGRDYLVKQVRTVTHLDDLAEWWFYRLSDPDEELWLLAKIVGSEIALRVYFEPPEFPAGDRAHLIEHEMFWLFQEPPDPDNFSLTDLEFTEQLEQVLEEADGEVEVTFVLKPQGVQFGKMECEPSEKGLDDAFTAVVEYGTDDETESPELLLLEVGGEDGERGGHISLYLGNDLNFAEVEVLDSGAVV